ncbi:MAG TPA: DNA repair protein RecN [Rhodanobacteraceae bacterium]|nr:DNA repair protein RecN [Rhodanobacteraceae bacterium]
MLETLTVKDFAIVAEADIAFGPGMTVVTGETGAGKSLLVDALLLLAGGRADAAQVRHGCERAELAATFDLSSRPDLVDWLKSEELDEDDACQLRRVIRSEGSSRAWINGRPVTLTQLKALASGLIEIHGQHEHQALLDPAHQLALLDAFGANADELAETAHLARAWRDTAARIAELTRGEDHAARIDWLTHQLDELDRHALAPDALAALEDEHRRLANAGQLLQGGNGLAERLDGDSEFALAGLAARAHAEALRLAALDVRMTPIVDLLDAAQIQLTEASDTLSRYQSALELDPDRLAEVEAQIAKLHELSRKHRVPMTGLASHATSLREELETLRGAGASLEALRATQKKLAADYASAAKKLTAKRIAAAKKLGATVSSLMGELGMRGLFEIELAPGGNDEPDANGAERCEFLVAANPGTPTRPLRKVASGGELSRISLALEVAAIGLDPVGTMVFDEVDSGIGGAVAEVVGRKLRDLGAKSQVLCVTHLPQVAALGHQHLRVVKQSGSDATRVRIETLAKDTRRDEIARMLGGIEITRETMAHAEQMLGSAAPTAAAKRKRS